EADRQQLAVGTEGPAGEVPPASQLGKSLAFRVPQFPALDRHLALGIGPDRCADPRPERDARGGQADLQLAQRVLQDGTSLRILGRELLEAGRQLVELVPEDTLEPLTVPPGTVAAPPADGAKRRHRTAGSHALRRRQPDAGIPVPKKLDERGYGFVHEEAVPQLPGRLPARGRRFGRRLLLQLLEGLVQLVRAAGSRDAAQDGGNNPQAEKTDVETLHERVLLLGRTLPLFVVSPNGPPRPAPGAGSAAARPRRRSARQRRGPRPSHPSRTGYSSGELHRAG